MPAEPLAGAPACRSGGSRPRSPRSPDADAQRCSESTVSLAPKQLDPQVVEIGARPEPTAQGFGPASSTSTSPARGSGPVDEPSVPKPRKDHPDCVAASPRTHARTLTVAPFPPSRVTTVMSSIPSSGRRQDRNGALDAAEGEEIERSPRDGRWCRRSPGRRGHVTGRYPVGARRAVHPHHDAVRARVQAVGQRRTRTADARPRGNPAARRSARPPRGS